MDQTREDQAVRAVRAAIGGGAIAVLIALAALATGTATTKAVELGQATTLAVEANGNGPTGYFPAQFASVDGEVAPHIEAF